MSVWSFYNNSSKRKRLKPLAYYLALYKLRKIRSNSTHKITTIICTYLLTIRNQNVLIIMWAFVWTYHREIKDYLQCHLISTYVLCIIIECTFLSERRHYVSPSRDLQISLVLVSFNKSVYYSFFIRSLVFRSTYYVRLSTGLKLQCRPNYYYIQGTLTIGMYNK